MYKRVFEKLEDKKFRNQKKTPVLVGTYYHVIYKKCVSCLFLLFSQFCSQLVKCLSHEKDSKKWQQGELRVWVL